jgi:hypothetical protein
MGTTTFQTINISTPDKLIEFYQNYGYQAVLSSTLTPKINEIFKKFLTKTADIFKGRLESCSLFPKPTLRPCMKDGRVTRVIAECSHIRLC